MSKVKKFNTKFFINFPSNSYRENSKHHNMKHFTCVCILNVYENAYLTITIHLQTKLNINYYNLKSINRRYLKNSPVI